MRSLIISWMCCGAMLAITSSAEAQFGRRPFAHPGAPCPGGCGAAYAPPVAPCPCAVQQPIVQVQPCQTQFQPVVQTHLQPQQMVTYRDVAVTQYRQEQFTTQVPVTTMQQVIRDAGAYQMVWVPRVETVQVPQTTYQTQIGYRTVPYQATQRVAQVETRMIPQQTVQYVPQARVAGTCCPQTGVYQQAMLPGYGYGGAVIPQTFAPAPGTPTIQSSPAQQQLVPNPPETSLHNDWQTVEPRHATAPTDATTSMIPSAAVIQTRQTSFSVVR